MDPALHSSSAINVPHWQSSCPVDVATSPLTIIPIKAEYTATQNWIRKCFPIQYSPFIRPKNNWLLILLLPLLFAENRWIRMLILSRWISRTRLVFSICEIEKTAKLRELRTLLKFRKMNAMQVGQVLPARNLRFFEQGQKSIIAKEWYKD